MGQEKARISRIYQEKIGIPFCAVCLPINRSEHPLWGRLSASRFCSSIECLDEWDRVGHRTNSPDLVYYHVPRGRLRAAPTVKRRIFFHSFSTAIHSLSQEIHSSLHRLSHFRGSSFILEMFVIHQKSHYFLPFSFKFCLIISQKMRCCLRFLPRKRRFLLQFSFLYFPFINYPDLTYPYLSYPYLT